VSAPAGFGQVAESELNPRRWQVLGVLIVSLLVVVLDNTVLNVALPTIQTDLGATQEQLIWAVNAYVCTFAAFLFTWGVLGDRYGRKKILMIGLALFGLASAATAWADSPIQLIINRGIMGFGAASVLPVTLAIITVIFPPAERGKAIGIWAAAVGGAVALGPLVGGLLVDNFWWGSVFLINVPIVILGLIGIQMLVPESRNPNPGRLDPFGVVVSVGGLLLLTYGILHGGDTQEWSSPEVWGPIVGGVALILFFLWFESRSDHPSIDLSLFKIRSFSSALGAASFTFAALNGTLLFLTFYLQTVRGLSPLQAGSMVLPVAVGQLLGAPRSNKMVRRFGARKVVSTGLIIAGAAFALVGTLGATTPYWVVGLLFFLLGFGMGNVIAPCTTRMTLVTPPARSGVGSAMQNTVRQVAAAIGIAVIASAVSVVYANGVEKELTGFPPEVVDTASDSIGATHGLINAAVEQGRVTAAQAEQLLAQADQVFLNSLGVASLLAVLLILAALVLVLLRLPATPEVVAWGANAGGGVVDPAAEAADAAAAEGPAPTAPPRE
jgi:EmrB/QacA subfamily drug resistance transporter